MSSPQIQKIREVCSSVIEARAKAYGGKWSVTRMHRGNKTWNQIFSSKTRSAIFPEAESSDTFALNDNIQFIALAANHSSQLAKSLLIAVEALDYITSDNANRALIMHVKANEALEQITSQLMGET